MRHAGTALRLLLTLLTMLLAGAILAEETADPPVDGADEQADADKDSARPDTRHARGDSVFADIIRDPVLRRYGHAPGRGWIVIPGVPTELRLGGFIQLNIIHDFEETGFPYGDFIPALIPVPTDSVDNTEFDPRSSRFTFETRTDTAEVGSVETMISMDFAGDDGDATLDPRLRQAYVSWVGPFSHVSFTAGQAWTTYTDLRAQPDLFDLEGPNASTGIRQGLVRGSYAFGEKKQWVADLAVEEPETLVANGNGLESAPDTVARLNWQRDWGHLQVAALARQLIAESTEGTGKDSAFGWGLSLSGTWLVPFTRREDAPSDDLGARQDNIQFQVQGGRGTARYVADPGSAPTPQDAVYDDASARILPLYEFGAYAAYQHWWTDRLRSEFVYGWTKMKNISIQAPTVFDRSTYVVANILFRPFRRMDIGIEYYYGERTNKNGDTGHANRLLFGLNFGF